MFLYLLLASFTILILYFWRKILPYFAFPQYFWIDWDFILAILRGKGPQNEHLKQYLSQKQLKVFEKFSTDGMFVFWMLWKPVIVVYGPEPYKFLANEQNLIDKPAWIYNFISIINENGIFRSNGERMKRQRKLFRPAFFPSTLKQQATTMNVHARDLVKRLKKLKENITNDLEGLCKKSTMLLIMDTTLGFNPDTEEKECQLKKCLEMTTKFMDFTIYRGFRPWLHPNFMLHLFSEGRDYLKIEKEFSRIGKKLVEDLKESYRSHIQETNMQNTDTHVNGQWKNTFGNALIEEHLKDPLFTLEDLQTELLTLTVGGTDTTAECLTWTIWLLGLEEKVQDKAYEEVKSLTDEEIHYEDALNLSYLECIIKESLRLYPTCPFFPRQASKDIYFDKYLIPEGATVAFVSYALHRNPELYPNPETFNPERFAENVIDAVNPWALLPFAEGVRSCIGKNYAMLDLKIFLAYIIRNFKIVSLSSREEVQLTWGITLKSEDPISVKFIPR